MYYSASQRLYATVKVGNSNTEQLVVIDPVSGDMELLGDFALTSNVISHA